MKTSANVEACFTLQDALSCCKSERLLDYPEVFADTCGLDIVIPEKKLHATPSWGHTKGNKKRRVSLEIRTFRGVSYGAIHYYGKLMVQGVCMEFDEKPGVSTTLLDDDIPLSLYLYELTLKRQLTQSEIDNDPERFGKRLYRAGMMVDRFNTQDAIVQLAKKVFALRFSGNWELRATDVHGRKIEI